MILGEFFLYVGIFRHLSELNVTVESMLSEQTRRMRKQRNAIGFLGHACQFAINLTYIAVGDVLNGLGYLATKHVIMSLKPVINAVIEVIKLMTSVTLRNEFKLIAQRIKMFKHD